MGLAVTSIESETINTALIQFGKIWSCHDWYETVTVNDWVTIFKQTVNVDNLEDLVLIHQSDGAGRHIQLTCGTTTTGDTGCTATRAYEILDVSGESGLQTITIEIKGNGVDDFHVYDLDLYHKES